MKSKTSLPLLSAIYLIMFIIQVIVLPASVGAIMLLFLTGVIGAVHVHFANKRNKKINWAAINRPFAVIDWGREGKHFELPERHEGYYIACSAAQVKNEMDYVKYSLSMSGNPAFIKSNMPVLEFYFRKGAHILEDQDQYRARVLEDFDRALVLWHTTLEKQGEAYRKAYLADNQNGSAPE